MSTLSPQKILRQGQLGQLHDPALLKELLWECELLDLPGGATLFELNEPSDGSFYLVLAGGLQISFSQEDGSSDYKEKQAGDFCGESALVTQAHLRTATVKVSPGGVKLMRWADGPVLLARPDMLPLRKLLEKFAGYHWIETSIRTALQA